MRKLLLLIIFLPLISQSQVKYSTSGKKLFKQASDAYRNGNTEEAVRLFEECLKEDDFCAEAHLNLSIIHFHQGNFERSMTYAQNAYNYNRFQPEIYEQLGKNYFQRQQYDSSTFYLKQAVEFGGKSDEIHLYLGQSMLHVGDYSGSVKYLTKVLENNPNDAQLYNDRGSAYYNLGDTEKAEADLKKALDMKIEGAGIYLNLATMALDNDSILVSKGYLAKAEGLAKSTEEKVQVLIIKGQHYIHEGDLENAKSTFSAAFELDKKNATVLTNQAVIAIQQDDYQTAWQKCNLALEQDDELIAAYFNRGIANEMLRRTSDACLDWEQAFILGSEKAEEYLNSPICNE
ncbi:MAG: tetratricopeptide repeat protein [Flavobacteriales bacterium]|nr:tetratricopeptide repeat protein [Flavobacteriales bacterium]